MECLSSQEHREADLSYIARAILLVTCLQGKQAFFAPVALPEAPSLPSLFLSAKN